MWPTNPAVLNSLRGLLAYCNACEDAPDCYGTGPTTALLPTSPYDHHKEFVELLEKKDILKKKVKFLGEVDERQSANDAGMNPRESSICKCAAGKTRYSQRQLSAKVAIWRLMGMACREGYEVRSFWCSFRNSLTFRSIASFLNDIFRTPISRARLLNAAPSMGSRNIPASFFSFEEISITVRSWVDFVTEENISQIDLMVLDVEGHELNVLSGMAQTTIRPSASIDN